jgi:hypothetical protein
LRSREFSRTICASRADLCTAATFSSNSIPFALVQGWLTVSDLEHSEIVSVRDEDRAPALEGCYRAVIDAVREHVHGAPGALFIGGKSMGGRIATQVAAADVEVDLICAQKLAEDLCHRRRVRTVGCGVLGMVGRSHERPPTRVFDRRGIAVIEPGDRSVAVCRRR